MSYDFNNDLPIYLQIIERIKMQIIKSEFKPLDKLPSVRELSCIYEVNPNTVQKALFELESMGLIFTERTNGKFVTGDIKVINELKSQTVDKMVGEFLTSMQNLGYSKEEVIDILKRQD
jgi:DNA-binding transcriptional regulator YhcF (GntR family)